MKKFKKIAALLLIILLLTNCGEKKLELNQEVTLTGKVTVKEVTENDEKIKVSYFELDEPIIIDGEKIYQIELDYDKEIKNNSELSITGTITNNDNSSLSLTVSDIDDILSYINTFSNEEFSMTIPASLIKISTIKRIDNGFIIYSTSNMSNGGEVFRIVSVTNDEFKQLNKNETKYIEKITSTKEKTIIIQYPSTIEYTEENFTDYETIANSINTIKDNVRFK